MARVRVEAALAAFYRSGLGVLTGPRPLGHSIATLSWPMATTGNAMTRYALRPRAHRRGTNGPRRGLAPWLWAAFTLVQGCNAEQPAVPVHRDAIISELADAGSDPADSLLADAAAHERDSPGASADDASSSSSQPAATTQTGHSETGTEAGEPGPDAIRRPAGAQTSLSAAEAPAHPQAGWAALTDWAGQPRLIGSGTRMFTSTEPAQEVPWPFFDAGNKDFNNFLAVCGDRPVTVFQTESDPSLCEPGREGYLIAAADGPGYVSRLVLAVGYFDLLANSGEAIPVANKPTNETLRIYVDDEPQPVFAGTWQDLLDGTYAPFAAPLTGWSSGLVVSYVPISYAQRIRVFIDDLLPGLVAYYYNVATDDVAQTESFDSSSLADPQAVADLDASMASLHDASNLGDTWLDDEFTVEPGATVEVWSREQPATLTRLQLEIPKETASATLDETRLQIHWGGASTPAFDLALADLFGARPKLASFTTWPMRVQPSDDHVQLSLSLPMPFASARLQLSSHADAQGPHRLRVRLVGQDALPAAPWGTLHAQLRVENSPEPGERFLVAELSGPGKYVGTLMMMRGGPFSEQAFLTLPGPMPLNFLEGDDRLEVDGEISQGTGTEESFNGGWYFSDGPFDSPFAALLHLYEDPQGTRGEATAVRWNVLSDAIPFQTSFRLSYEYGANHPQTASEYRGVAFFYQ